jgi:hypothetical protein
MAMLVFPDSLSRYLAVEDPCYVSGSIFTLFFLKDLMYLLGMTSHLIFCPYTHSSDKNKKHLSNG